MAFWQTFIALVLSYLCGAFPVGWIIVWVLAKKDIRYHASGRMGTSNVIRLVGVPWGVFTAIFDFLKGVGAIWITRWILKTPEPWIEALAGILAVLGHIYSVIIIERRWNGKMVLRGGAGGMTSVGAAVGLWAPILLWIGIPAIALYLLLGYASVATISLNVTATLIFLIMKLFNIEPNSWWYVIYSASALALVLIALKPNLNRLRKGEERVMKFSLHAKLKKK